MQLPTDQVRRYLTEMGVPFIIPKQASSPQEAYHIAAEIGSPVIVWAYDSPAYNFETATVRHVQTPEQAKIAAAEILTLLRDGQQSGRVAFAANIEIETIVSLYVGYDWLVGRPLISARGDSNNGLGQSGRNPNVVTVSERVDPLAGLQPYQCRSLASGLDLPYEVWDSFISIVLKAYEFFQRDLLNLDLNPLILTKTNALFVLSANVTVDVNALYRYPEWMVSDNTSALGGQNWQPLSDNPNQGVHSVGCMANGRALAETAADLLGLSGEGNIQVGKLVDIGSNPSPKDVADTMHHLLTNAAVSVLLICLFVNIPCDIYAQTIIRHPELLLQKPIVVYLAGEKSAEAHDILMQAGLPKLFSASTLAQAIEKTAAVIRSGV